MTDMMFQGGLLGWGLIVRDRQEGLLAQARGDWPAGTERADRPSSLLRVALRRIVAWRAGTGTTEGIDR